MAAFVALVAAFSSLVAAFVALDTRANNQILRYDSTAEKWVNIGTVGSAQVPVYVNNGVLTQISVDSAPTSVSSKLVESGGVYTALENKVDWQTNGILGAKNLFNFDAWKNVPIFNGTAVWGDNSVTLTATADDAYTEFVTGAYPEGARVYVEEGKTYTMTWECDDVAGNVIIFNESTSTGVAASATDKKLSHTIPSGVSYITIRFGVANAGASNTFSNIMIRLADDTDPTYRPYAMTNKQLTDLIGEGGISEEEVTVAMGSWASESYTSTSGTVYAYKYSVPITGLTASSWVDIDISSGSFAWSFAIESTSGYAVIRISSRPYASLTFRIYYKL